MPYDRAESELLRAQGRRIVACFQCVVEKRPKPYWPLESVDYGGAMIFCHEHFDSVSLGKAVIGELPPL